MEKPTFIGQWIKGDNLSDLVVYVLKADGSGKPYDLTGLTAASLLLNSRDGATAIGVDGDVVTDGTVDDQAGDPATNADQGVLRFADLTADWTPASAATELFEAWVTLTLPGRFGYCRPSLSLEFRKAPVAAA